MSLAFRNEIDITVWLASGRIADVAIQPRSRPPLTRLFAGKPVAALQGVLPRLFSLCSVAHQVAFLSAVEAARGQDASTDARERRVTAIVAERLTELLRGLFVGRLALDGASAAAVRAMMQASSVLGGSIVEQDEGASRREAVAEIRAALRTLGIGHDGDTPAPGSALAAHLARCDNNVFLPPMTEQTYLSAADDLDVAMRLSSGGAAFSGAPDLDGRVPETGVWARRIGRDQALPRDAGPAERLKARIAEVARLCAWLDGDAGVFEDTAIESYRLGPGKGAAAVECARGRLYHAVELDDEDRLVRFEFLAPTEWNFHARGPLVRSLKGSALAAGRQGQDAVRSLIGSFDPCVGFNLNFREAGHA